LAPASDTVSRMCHRNDDFTILEKANEGVGITFTIRKTTPSFKADCTFEERPTESIHMTPTLVEKSIFHFGTMKMESLKARRCMIPQGEYSGGYMINGVRQD
jgi:hypothetical protein